MSTPVVSLALATQASAERWWIPWLPVLTAFFQLLAVLLPALVALRGLGSWWHEARGRRAMELAEEVLATVYESQVAIAMLRNPFAAGSEGEEAKTQAGDTSDRGPHALFVLQDRYQTAKDTFARLQSVRYRFQAYFGDEARAALDGIIDVTNRIFVHAKVLFELDRQGSAARGENYKDRYWESMRVIYGSGDDDPIAAEVDARVKEVEAIVRPVLTRGGRRRR